MASDEDEKSMARYGLSKHIKFESLQDILFKELIEKPTHENNIKALEDSFNGS